MHREKEEEDNLDAFLKNPKTTTPISYRRYNNWCDMTYYYGFLYSIIVNSAIWMLISFIVNKYYYKSTGLKDEGLQYGLAKINTRTRRT
jgi:hypothetical protein